jgi:hypothetical protein
MGGGGSTYDYGFRIYNPSIGKFLSVDPLGGKFPWYTPYQFAGNKPIIALDIDGLEDELVPYANRYQYYPVLDAPDFLTGTSNACHNIMRFPINIVNSTYNLLPATVNTIYEGAQNDRGLGYAASSLESSGNKFFRQAGRDFKSFGKLSNSDKLSAVGGSFTDLNNWEFAASLFFANKFAKFKFSAPAIVQEAPIGIPRQNVYIGIKYIDDQASHVTIGLPEGDDIIWTHHRAAKGAFESGGLYFGKGLTTYANPPSAGWSVIKIPAGNINKGIQAAQFSMKNNLTYNPVTNSCVSYSKYVMKSMGIKSGKGILTPRQFEKYSSKLPGAVKYKLK